MFNRRRLRRGRTGGAFLHSGGRLPLPVCVLSQYYRSNRIMHMSSHLFIINPGMSVFLRARVVAHAAKRQTSRLKLRQEGVVEPLSSLLHFVEASYRVRLPGA
jgi:hypothetical protein